jgi:hypothetical protein
MENSIAAVGIVHVKAFPHIESWIMREKAAKSTIDSNYEGVTCRIVKFICYRHFGHQSSSIDGAMDHQFW